MKSTICIIDDDPIALFGLSKLLTKTQYVESISTFEDGELALETLRPHLENDSDACPDVIFLDLNMPIMDGWQFLDEYKRIERPEDSDIILLYVVSSSNHRTDLDRAKEYPVINGYMVKPVNRDNLRHVFEEDLPRYRKSS
jgi:CheY-like chemotaxis protein